MLVILLRKEGGQPDWAQSPNDVSIPSVAAAMDARDGDMILVVRDPSSHNARVKSYRVIFPPAPTLTLEED